MWLAPLDGGRAWRVSADRTCPSTTRASRPTAPRSPGPPPATAHPRCISPPRRRRPRQAPHALGQPKTQVRGWTPEGAGPRPQHLRARPACAAVGPAPSRSTADLATTLPYGPVGDVAHGPRTVLLSAPMGREAAWWKRYRGGTAGQVVDRRRHRRSSLEAGVAGEFTRLHSDLDGNIEYPSGSATGSRSSPTTRAPARSTPPSPTAPSCAGTPLSTASTPGTPPPTAPASSTPAPVNSSVLDDLDAAEPRRLDIRLPAARASTSRRTR